MSVNRQLMLANDFRVSESSRKLRRAAYTDVMSSSFTSEKQRLEDLTRLNQ